MKKRRLLIISALSVLMAFVVFMISLAFYGTGTIRTGYSSGAVINMSFTLKDYDGYLALYRGDADEPYLILENRTMFLNEYDRKQVQKGISVYSEKEIRILIEDMTG